MNDSAATAGTPHPTPGGRDLESNPIHPQRQIFLLEPMKTFSGLPRHVQALTGLTALFTFIALTCMSLVGCSSVETSLRKDLAGQVDRALGTFQLQIENTPPEQLDRVREFFEGFRAEVRALILKQAVEYPAMSVHEAQP